MIGTPTGALLHVAPLLWLPFLIISKYLIAKDTRDETPCVDRLTVCLIYLHSWWDNCSHYPYDAIDDNFESQKAITDNNLRQKLAELN